MSTIAFDLEQLYRRTFGGKPYKVADSISGNEKETPFLINSTESTVALTSLASKLKEEHMQKEIWLPTRFFKEDGKEFLFLPYSVIKISGKKTIVKTPMAERQGTVKELFSIDDYSISIKGFLIDDENRLWPEEQLKALKELYELQQAVILENALTNVFLINSQKVVIESLELPEVEGGRKHVRPFNMQLESDSIFTLEAE